jgi:hypothetical protein
MARGGTAALRACGQERSTRGQRTRIVRVRGGRKASRRLQSRDAARMSALSARRARGRGDLCEDSLVAVRDFRLRLVQLLEQLLELLLRMRACRVSTRRERSRSPGALRPCLVRRCRLDRQPRADLERRVPQPHNPAPARPSLRATRALRAVGAPLPEVLVASERQHDARAVRDVGRHATSDVARWCGARLPNAESSAARSRGPMSSRMLKRTP